MATEQRLGRSAWIEIIKDFEVSGLSLKKFGEERGLAHHCLQYWRRKLSRVAGADVTVASGFSRVKVVSEQMAADFKIDVMVGRIAVMGPKLPSPQWLGQLSQELGR